MKSVPINISSSAAICTGECWIDGFYVNSTSSGAFKLWNNASTNSGQLISNTITPAIGAHNLFGVHGTVGVFVDGMAGSWDVTFFIREQD